MPTSQTPASHADDPTAPHSASEAHAPLAAGEAGVSHIGSAAAAIEPAAPAPIEVGGRGGLEPTRFGDWEKGGRCIDF